MPRYYRASNKRLIARGGNGRFRKGALADIDLACCETCGAIFTPTIPDKPMIDPREVRQLQRFCPEHGGQGERTGLKVDPAPDNQGN